VRESGSEAFSAVAAGATVLDNKGYDRKDFDPNTGKLSPSQGVGGPVAVDVGLPSRGLPAARGARDPGERTAARNAVFQSLVREEGGSDGGAGGGRDGLLAGLVRRANQHPGATRAQFYSTARNTASSVARCETVIDMTGQSLC
jgi:hypothetical protein